MVRSRMLPLVPIIDGDLIPSISDLLRNLRLIKIVDSPTQLTVETNFAPPYKASGSIHRSRILRERCPGNAASRSLSRDLENRFLVSMPKQADKQAAISPRSHARPFVAREQQRDTAMDGSSWLRERGAERSECEDRCSFHGPSRRISPMAQSVIFPREFRSV